MLAEPLYCLSRKNIPFVWSNEQEQAVNYMRKMLPSFPITQFPDFSMPFYIQSDASEKGFGAIVGQIHNGTELVVT